MTKRNAASESVEESNPASVGLSMRKSEGSRKEPGEFFYFLFLPKKSEEKAERKIEISYNTRDTEPGFPREDLEYKEARMGLSLVVRGWENNGPGRRVCVNNEPRRRDEETVQRVSAGPCLRGARRSSPPVRSSRIRRPRAILHNFGYFGPRAHRKMHSGGGALSSVKNGGCCTVLEPKAGWL